MNTFNKKVPLIGFSSSKTENIVFLLYHQLTFALKVLKLYTGFQYNLLTSIAGIDHLHSKHRFCVAYDLLSLTYNTRLRVKIFINEIAVIASLETIFINANWWEREIWDFFGLYFKNHSDLRRILTDYGFEGFPMRKDFPLAGFVEVRFNQTKKQVVLTKVELAQEKRIFVFESCWN